MPRQQAVFGTTLAAVVRVISITSMRVDNLTERRGALVRRGRESSSERFFYSLAIPLVVTGMQGHCIAWTCKVAWLSGTSQSTSNAGHVEMERYRCASSMSLSPKTQRSKSSSLCIIYLPYSAYLGTSSVLATF